jgi:hypothetical protein
MFAARDLAQVAVQNFLRRALVGSDLAPDSFAAGVGEINRPSITFLVNSSRVFFILLAF